MVILLPFFLFALHGLHLVALDPDLLCLEDGIHSSHRQQLLVSGRNITIGSSSSYWTSQELAARIQTILVREVLGVHVGVVADDAMDTTPQYFGIAGCQDALDWSCTDYNSSDPIFHWTPEYWQQERSSHKKALEDELGEAFADEMIIDAGALGYVGRVAIFVMADLVQRALAATNRTVSLDWHVDLEEETSITYFTPLSQMDTSWGFYQFCDHTEADLLRGMGYECNETFEYENPWRQTTDGEWSEDGDWPKTLFPVKDCDAMVRDHAEIVARYTAEGFECRGAGWWISAPCAAESPGSEYMDKCIPVLSYDVNFAIADYKGLALLRVAMATISEFDALEEYFYDWTEGHQERGGDRINILFEWWEPDASIPLNYGELDYSRVNFFRGRASYPIAASTLVNAQLGFAAPGVLDFLKNFRLHGEDMEFLMRAVVKASRALTLEAAKDEVACRWVVERRSTWEIFFGTCLANHYFDTVLKHCRQCPTGSISPSNSIGIEACMPCAKGSRYDVDAQSCALCLQGYYTDTSGQSECTLCPVGRYEAQLGSTECRSCPDSFVTRGSGKRAISDCECPAGTFFNASREIPLDRDSGAWRAADSNNATGGAGGAARGGRRTPTAPPAAWGRQREEGGAEGGRCVACTDMSSAGLDCPGGFPHPQHKMTLAESQDMTPRVQDGYMSLPEKPLQVYTCVHGESRCVGLRSPFGGDVMCAQKSALVPQCASCKDGFWGDLAGNCVQCSGAVSNSMLKILLACAASGVVTLYLYVRFNRPGPSGLIIMTQLLTFIQSLQALGDLLEKWPPPLNLLFEGVDLFTFDKLYDFFSFQIACFTGQRPITSLLEKALGPLFLFFDFVVLGLLNRAFRGVWLDMDCVINVWGLVFTRLFITLSRLTLDTFLVDTMPSGVVMVKSLPTLEFGSEEWLQLLPISITTFVVYCLGTLAVVMHAVYRAPTWAATWPRFAVRYRFCFGAFRPDRWWWVLVSLARALILNIVQAVARIPANQLYLSICVIASHLFLEVKFLPYKFKDPNAASISLGIALLAMLVFSTAFAHDSSSTEDMTESEKQVIITMYSSLAALAIVASTSFSLGRICVWFRSIRQYPGCEAGRAARIALCFRDVATVQSHLSTRELFQAISRMNEMDLQILSKATKIMATTMLKKQIGTGWFEQRLMPGIPKEVWQSHKVASEVLQSSISKSHVASDMENSRGRLRLVALANRLFNLDEEQTPAQRRSQTRKSTGEQLVASCVVSGRGHLSTGAAAHRGWSYAARAAAMLKHTFGKSDPISLEDFCSSLQAQLQGEFSPEAAQEIFELIDVNGSGSITPYDFVAVMMAMAPQDLVRMVSSMSVDAVDGQESVAHGAGYTHRPTRDPTIGEGSDPDQGTGEGAGEDEDCGTNLATEGQVRTPLASSALPQGAVAHPSGESNSAGGAMLCGSEGN